MATIEVRGCCPHDCPDTCAWIAEVTDGEVTKVRGDPLHPVTTGHLCVKVQHYEERLGHPDRLLAPLVRVAPKDVVGRSAFREATWDEALAVAADGLRRAVETRGPLSVLPFSYYGTQGVLQSESMGRRFAHRLGAADLDGTICFAAGGWAYGLTHPGWPETDIEDVPNAELVVAWGANMVSTHLHLWPFLLEARKRGATIVVVDPVRTRTARAADLHLALRPGSDGALALGMLHVIFAEGLEDRSFLEERTVGWEELAARAQQWPLDRAAAATGLDERVIASFARQFAHAQPAFVKLAPGAQRHAAAGQAFRAVLALPAVTGAWRHRGGGAHVHSAGSFPDRGDAMTRPDLRPGGPDATRRLVNMIRLGRALDGAAPDGDGEDPHGPIGALVVSSSNPAVVCPDSASVRRGLTREDLCVIVAEQFLTETAAHADVVFPATTQLEHLDVFWSWGHRYVTLNLPAVPPKGDSAPNTEIFRRLAGAMGFDDDAFADDDEALVATYLAGYPETVAAEVRARGWAKVTPVADPDAKIQLRCDAMVEFGLDPVPDAPDAAVLVPSDGRLTLVTPKSHHFLNSQFTNHARLARMAGEPTILLSPTDADASGVTDGAVVSVTSDTGALRCAAEISDTVRDGTAVLFSNWWHESMDGKAAVNVLTSQATTDLGGAPVFTTRVSVLPV